MKYLYTVLLFLGVGGKLMAQTNASPYSIIGLGDIETSNFDRSAGMADAGVSLVQGKFQYHANPASYARLDDHFFSVEMSGRFRAVSYTGADIQGSAHSTDMQIEKLTMAIKLKHWWGTSLGILPFSSSNYSFTAPKYIQGTTSSVPASYTGRGGLHKAYFAQSFEPIKNLTVGAELEYLWGDLSQEEVASTSSVIGGTLDTKQDNYLSKVALKYGILYNGRLSKKWSIGAGATYFKKTDLNTDASLTVIDGNTTIVNDQSFNYGKLSLPTMTNVGASVTYNNRYTLAGNYEFQKWSETNNKGLGYSLVDADRYSLGFEYSGLVNNLYEKYYLQAGTFYGHTYLHVNNNWQKDYGVTLGAGLNTSSRGAGLMTYQLNLQIGNRGSTSNGGIKQAYTQVGFSVIFRDLWGIKTKYE